MSLAWGTLRRAKLGDGSRRGAVSRDRSLALTAANPRWASPAKTFSETSEPPKAPKLQNLSKASQTFRDRRANCRNGAKQVSGKLREIAEIGASATGAGFATLIHLAGAFDGKPDQ